MKRIRSKSIKGKRAYLLISKIVALTVLLFIAATAIMGLSVYKTGKYLISGAGWITESILSNNYEAEFNDCKIEVTGSEETITYRITDSGVTNTIVTSDKSGSYFISIDNVQWGSGNTWLEVPKSMLVNTRGDTWVPQDMLRYVDISKITELKEPTYSNMIDIGIIGIKSFIGIKTPIVANAETVSIVGTTYMKNSDKINRTTIKIMDSWEDGLSSISCIDIIPNGIRVHTDKGVMSVKTIKSNANGLSWEAMQKVIQSSCAHIDQLDYNLSGKIFELYKNGNNIIDSVKGALRNE